MKIIYNCYNNGFFEFVEYPPTKDSRKMLIDKNRCYMYKYNLHKVFDISELAEVISFKNFELEGT